MGLFRGRKNNQKQLKNTSADIISAPVTASGAVGGEVVAVIAAAVASIYPGFSVKGIYCGDGADNRRLGRHSVWRNVGLVENTRSF